MTASHSSATPVTKTATVTVGSAPILNTITDSNYSTYITTSSVIIAWGQGFAIHGGNSIQLHNVSTGVDYWLYEGGGRYFWDNSYSQINGALGGAVPPGNYTVYVFNGFSPYPSNGYSITIH